MQHSNLPLRDLILTLMHETATLTLAIIGAVITWTASIISLVIWLTSKFRYLEKTIYREMDKHRRDDDAMFRYQGTKIQRLEIGVFGFTNEGLGVPQPMLPQRDPAE